jgi:sugar-phosphatase
MALPRIAAVLFDMDGTLVDSDAAVDRAWTAWAQEYGVDPRYLTSIAPGHPAGDTVAKVLADRGPEVVAEATARILGRESDDVSDVVAAPGAHEVLARLQELGIPWAVVTGADTRLAKARLNAARITAPILLTTDDVARGKPDPAGYLRAAELLGVAADECLVVEDTEPGAAAGRAAGARVATLKGLADDLPIESLRDLLPLLGDETIPAAAPTA